MKRIQTMLVTSVTFALSILPFHGATLPRSYASDPANPNGPPDAVASMIMRKPIFPLAVHTLAFSPDGRSVAGGDGYGRLRLWEVATGKLINEIAAHSNWVFSVGWTKDGTGIITGGGDNLVRRFDAAKPDSPGRTLLAHTNDVHAVALTKDGKTLFSTGDDRQVVVWDLDQSTAELRFRGHERPIPTLLLSPDETLIASGSRDHTIRLWNARTGALRDTLIGHTGDVLALSFSPDGRLLASAGWDYTVRLWDVHSGKAVQVLLGHPNWVSGVAFSPNGRRLASSSGGRLAIFDPDTGKELWSTEFKGVIRSRTQPEGTETVESLPTGALPVVSNPNDQGFVDTIEDLSTVAFSPDNQILAVGSTIGAIYLVSAETGELVTTLRKP